MAVLFKLMALALVVAAAAPALASKVACGERCAARRARMHELREKSGSGVLHFTHDLYTELLRKAPRDFETVLLLNAVDPKRRCQPCAMAGSEFKVLANSYYRAHPDEEEKIFFVSVDFDGRENSEVFRKLQCQSAPVFFHIPKMGKPERHNAQMAQAEEMVSYVASIGGDKFEIYRPPNYAAMIFTLLVLVLIGGSLYAAWDRVSVIVFNARAWAFFSMAFSALMMSGHMWLQIRGAPFAVPSQDGGISYIAGSNSFQYGAESYIVMAFVLVISAGVIVLAEVSGPDKNMARHRSMTYVAAGVTAVAFGLYYSVFRQKYGGYPFRFIF